MVPDQKLGHRCRSRTCASSFQARAATVTTIGDKNNRIRSWFLNKRNLIAEGILKLEVRVGFEPTVMRICNPLHWATLPPHYKKTMVPKYGIEPSSTGYQPIALPLSYIGKFLFLPRQVGVCAWQFGQRHSKFSLLLFFLFPSL